MIKGESLAKNKCYCAIFLSKYDRFEGLLRHLLVKCDRKAVVISCKKKAMLYLVENMTSLTHRSFSAMEVISVQ